MTTPIQMTDKTGRYFLNVNSDGSIDATLVAGDIEIGVIEIKDAESDIRAKVKTDGSDNALVVTQNSVPTHAVTQSGTWNIGTVTTLTGITNNVNIGDISKGTQTNDVKITLDSEVVEVKADDENQRILDADDAVTTVNYTDSDKDAVSNIATASATLSRKVTDTYDNSGGTTLVITRVVANV